MTMRGGFRNPIIDGADIIVESINTDKLIVGSFDNLIQDPHFNDSEAWVLELNGGGTWSWGNAGTYGGELRFAPPSTTEARIYDTDIACSVGDRFYFEIIVWLSGASAGTARLSLSERLGDHTYNLVVTHGDVALSGSGFVTLTVTRTISEDDTEFIRPEIKVLGGATISSHVVFTRAYLRRLVNTPIVEDQAIDIQRQLDPVHNDRSADSGLNISLSTTRATTATITHTIPSWVGEAYFFLVHAGHIGGASGQNMTVSYQRVGGSDGVAGLTTDGSAVIEAVTTADSLVLVAPGSSVTLNGRAVLSSGTNASNLFHFAVFFSGLR